MRRVDRREVNRVVIDSHVERHGGCTVMLRDVVLPNGRTGILLEVSGEATSSAFAVCLERLVQRYPVPSHVLLVIDTRTSQRNTDAHGLFQQAAILAQVRVRRLSVCYLSQSETTAAVTPLIQDIFGQAHMPIEVHIAETLPQALDWLATRS